MYPPEPMNRQQRRAAARRNRNQQRGTTVHEHQPPAPEMVMPPVPPTPTQLVDVGNTLLCPTFAHLMAGGTNSNHGPLTAVTIRTPSTTLTVLIPRETAAEWSKTLAKAAEQTSPLLVPPAGALAGINGRH